MHILQFGRLIEDFWVVGGTAEVVVVDRHKTVHRCAVLEQKLPQLTHKVLLILIMPVEVETLSCYFLEHCLL